MCNAPVPSKIEQLSDLEKHCTSPGSLFLFLRLLVLILEFLECFFSSLFFFRFLAEVGTVVARKLGVYSRGGGKVK